MKITAAVVRKQGGPFEIETLELDDPQPDEVLVRVTAAGLCQTDLSVQHGHLHMAFPAVLGHEGTGVVEKVGSGVTDFAVGDTVVMSQAFCGHCLACRTGAAAYCTNVSKMSMSGRREDGSPTLHDGSGAVVGGNFVGQSSLASHSLVKARNVVRVPDGAAPELMAPLGCGMLTGAGAVLDDVQWPVAGTVAAFGLGAVGLAALFAAKAAGATTVIGVDRVPDRLAAATDLGIDHVVDGGTTDVPEEIRRLTGGLGVDLAVEAAGVPALVQVAVNSLTKTGKVVIVGAARRGATFELDWWSVVSGRTVKGAVVGGANPIVGVPRLVRYWEQGKLPLERMVHTYPFEAIEDAVADLAAGRVLKPVLVMPAA
jgi:aryl-alcohol dehydrogenase